MIVIGDINYIPQPGYPRLDGTDGDDTIKVKWITDDPVVPDYDTAFYDGRYPFFDNYSHLKLNKKSVVKQPGRYVVSLEYGEDEDDGTATVGGSSTVSTCANREVQVPITQHPNYRVCWNHDLHTTESGDAPGWTPDAKNTELATDVAKKYRWAEPGTMPDTGWRVCAAAKKPGVESYPVFLPEVTVVRTTSSKGYLTRTMAKDGTKQTPPDTFGMSGGEWLQVGSELAKEGKKWVLRTVYRWSLSIDSDIYD
jgi:hypothetical protein